MSTTVATAPVIRHRSAGFLATCWFVGKREVRLVWRTPAAFLPGLFIPVFFFFVQVGALGQVAAASGAFKHGYATFQLPVSILFAVSNGGAGLNMVSDIETGYFDKLLLTPVRRFALLLGAMGADFARVLAQGLFVVAIAMVTGKVHFGTGIPGALAMVGIASLWGLAYSAIGFGIALKTGNSQATQSAFVLFFPAVFLTTAFAPLPELSGWLQTAARYNPITYLLRAMRSLEVGWSPHLVFGGLVAIAAVGAVTLTLALLALRGRVK